MKVAIYTLTRDRLEYTKHCFEMLDLMAGHPFDHYVIDNGSTDGTVPWLNRWFEAKPDSRRVFFNPKNYGNCVGNNQAVAMIGPERYDLIIRMDNDCEVKTKGTVAACVDLYTKLKSMGHFLTYIVSPRVTGIVNQPPRLNEMHVNGFRLGIVGNIGGLFRVIPAPLLAQYQWPTEMSIVAGEECVAAWHRSRGGYVCYLEDYEVYHYETTGGQQARYPEYHQRKVAEWNNHPATDFEMPKVSA